MTLRWALERLRAIEKAQSEQQKRAETEAEQRRKAEAEKTRGAGKRRFVV